MRLGIAVLRVLLDGLFTGPGLQKLKGWFGGPGRDGTGAMFDGLGLRPGRHHATAAGVAETAGGALLAAGLLTPIAGSVLTGVMATAIRKVHGPKGLWTTQGGYEYNLTIIAAIFAIVDGGPGRLSLDEALGIERSGARRRGRTARGRRGWVGRSRRARRAVAAAGAGARVGTHRLRALPAAVRGAGRGGGARARARNRVCQPLAPVGVHPQREGARSVLAERARAPRPSLRQLPEGGQRYAVPLGQQNGRGERGEAQVGA
jgi:putative oxidoreductase